MPEFNDRRTPDKQARDLVSHHENNIDILARHTGLRLRGTHVEFPNGEMFPTIGPQELIEHHEEWGRGNGRPLEAHVRIPSETGRVHDITAYTDNANRDFDNKAAVGVAAMSDDPAVVHWTTHPGETFFEGPGVPEITDFAGELRSRIDKAGPPDERHRQRSLTLFRELGEHENSGKIETVRHEDGGDPLDESKWSSLHGTYDPRTRSVSDQHIEDWS